MIERNQPGDTEFRWGSEHNRGQIGANSSESASLPGEPAPRARRWAWVYEELADLQNADAEELRQAEDEAAPFVPRTTPDPAPADEVVDLGLIPYEDALEQVRRTSPPPPRRVHRRRRM
ncbi:hypothetical protein ACWECW_10720 [Rhodococcus ruber]